MKNYSYLLILFFNINKNVEKKYNLTDYFFNNNNKKNQIKIKDYFIVMENDFNIKINKYTNDKLSDYLLQFTSIWGNDSKIKIEHETWDK